MKWYIYIVLCKDNSLYTGIATDITRRIKEHNNGKGAKSLRGKLPVKLVYNEQFFSRSSASKREFEIKKLERIDKLKLIRAYR